MFLIKEKKQLNQNTVSMTVEAPKIAGKARPGQFVICLLYTSICPVSRALPNFHI